MSVWVTVDADYVIGTMPTALRVAYEAALAADPSKAGRLGVIAAGVVAEFRDALEREGVEELDADTATLPERAARHAAVLAWFYMAVEIGYALGVV